MTHPFTITRRVRFGDCDPGGILYTPRIGYFVVEAVLDFLGERLGGPAERAILEMGVLPPARALSVEFIKPMAWDDEVRIEVRVKEIRVHAIAFSIVGQVAEDVVFRAELTQVCVSPETRRPIPVPAPLRQALANDG